MDMNTLQAALKELFYSLGGSANDVRGTEDVNKIISEISALALGDAIKAGAELPAFPDDDDTYTLQLVMDDGAPTLSWESAGE